MVQYSISINKIYSAPADVSFSTLCLNFARFDERNVSFCQKRREDEKRRDRKSDRRDKDKSSSSRKDDKEKSRTKEKVGLLAFRYMFYYCCLDWLIELVKMKFPLFS